MLHIINLVKQGQSHLVPWTGADPRAASAPQQRQSLPGSTSDQAEDRAAAAAGNDEAPQKRRRTEARPRSHALCCPPGADEHTAAPPPTLVGDQIPLATEALQLLQGWTTAIWRDPWDPSTAAKGSPLVDTSRGRGYNQEAKTRGHGKLGHRRHPGH